MSLEKSFVMIEHSGPSYPLSSPFFYPSLRYWYSQRNRPTVYYRNVFEQLLCCHILHNKYTNIRYQYWLSLFLWLFLCSLASFINWQDRENCWGSLPLYRSRKVNMKYLFFILYFHIEASSGYRKFNISSFCRWNNHRVLVNLIMNYCYNYMY